MDYVEFDTEFRSSAAKALKRANGDILVAAKDLAAAINKRPGFVNAYAMALVIRAAAEAETKAIVPVRRHKRQRPRTKAERAAALQVGGALAKHVNENVFDYVIDGRRVGDIRWGELTKIVQDNATDAVQYLSLGVNRTTNCIWMQKVKHHSTVTDHSKSLEEVVPKRQMRAYHEEARREAVQLIAQLQQQMARQIQAVEVLT